MSTGMRESIGVAISTTGDPHRIGFLETCAQKWRDALPLGAVLIVTVDGDVDAVRRVEQAANPARFGNVFQIGQPGENWTGEPFGIRDGRLGVAANKNTGIEILMGENVKHLFLSDDDCWPRMAASVEKHLQMSRWDIPHSMVCWGKHRQPYRYAGYASWTWPRGVMMHVERRVVDAVGGLVEAFGPGGHEHVEWSNRIHNAGFTPTPYPTPGQYADDMGRAARLFWNCEDMQQRGEPLGNTRQRRRNLTSVRRVDGDWPEIEKIMAACEGSSEFVPYQASQNKRLSATLSLNLSAEEPQRR